MKKCRDAWRLLSLRLKRQGVRAGPDERCHDHIDGNIEATYYKWDDTDFRQRIDPAIEDQLSRIRIKELHVEVHKGAVV